MISTKEQQEHFMRIALGQAKDAVQYREVPIAALVVKDGIIISSAVNFRERNCDPTAHAEILALRAAGEKLKAWNLSGCDLVVTLEPCAMCAGAIVNARIDNVYFGAYDKRFGYMGSAGNIACDEKLNHRANVFGGILEEECLKPIQDFFKELRKK